MANGHSWWKSEPGIKRGCYFYSSSGRNCFSSIWGRDPWLAQSPATGTAWIQGTKPESL